MFLENGDADAARQMHSYRRLAFLRLPDIGGIGQDIARMDIGLSSLLSHTY
jgi:hypothetical protein